MAETNTYIKMEMNSGKEVPMTLNFYRLYLLKNEDPKLYEEYFKIESGKSLDEVQLCHQVYVAYVCATMDEEEREYPTFESFLMDMTESRQELFDTYFTLTGRKKKTATGKRSDTKGKAGQ